MIFLKEIKVETTMRQEMMDVTSRVSDVLAESGIKQGSCLVYCPHTTAAIAINENADPAVVLDTLAKLDELIPRVDSYRHAEGNSDAHIKSNLLGTSRLVPVQGARLLLGTWQSIFFCDFDGPRRRRFIVQIQGEQS
ncbi:MAG: YjbQ family protein [Deltaproteobacteria bacterium]|nr:YjbQ family protein [Deltaproteobacteria bacterium]